MPELDPHEQLEDLILQTDNPKDRAVLMILFKMSKALAENTRLTQELHTEFQKHSKEEVALIVRGRFLWRILLGVAFALQGYFAWVVVRHLDKFEKLQEQVQELRVQLSEVNVKLTRKEN